MYDRQTFTLWGNLTGQPVVGKMAASDMQLQMLPMTLTTWEEWRGLHPDTKVLRLDDRYGRQWNYRYEPGLADRARAGVRFPVWQKSKALDEKTEVYGLRFGEQAKAYPIKELISARIVNDVIANVPVVLVVDAESEAVRAYHRSSHKFSAGLTSRQLKDETGRDWIIQEDALLSDSNKLDRIPGHVSLWFAWFGFFPHTEIYSNPAR